MVTAAMKSENDCYLVGKQWETYTQVRKQQLELDMKQQTGSKQEKEYVKAVYCHSAYLTYMQCTSCEMPIWIKHTWNQDCQEKYQ